MKKFFAVILTFYQLLAANQVFAAGASLSISPGVGTFNKGCSFSVDIVVDTGGAQTDGTDAIIFYDTTRFSAVKVRDGTIYSDYPGSIIDPSAGKITISGLSSVTSTFSGAGTLASIDFMVLSNALEGATQITFDFDPNDKGKTTDSNIVERGTVADILSSVNNGAFTVGDGSCGSEPVVTPAGGLNGSPSTSDPNVLPQGGSIGGPVLIGVISGMLILLGILGLALL